MIKNCYLKFQSNLFLSIMWVVAQRTVIELNLFLIFYSYLSWGGKKLVICYQSLLSIDLTEIQGRINILHSWVEFLTVCHTGLYNTWTCSSICFDVFSSIITAKLWDMILLWKIDFTDKLKYFGFYKTYTILVHDRELSTCI